MCAQGESVREKVSCEVYLSTLLVESDWPKTSRRRPHRLLREDGGCRYRSRGTFSALALPFPPASGGAGGEQSWQEDRRNIRIIKEVFLGGDGDMVSSLPPFFGCNQLGLTSRVFLPELNHCPLTRVKCSAEKVELGYRTNPHANWSRTGFSRGAPSGFAAGRKDLKIVTECALK